MCLGNIGSLVIELLDKGGLGDEDNKLYFRGGGNHLLLVP